MAGAAPERTCVGCRGRATKAGLLRIVRGPAGDVELDRTGSAPGRGAYLHRRLDCLEAAFARGSLIVAPDGSVWVTRLGIAGAEVTLVDVFDASGRFVSQPTLPARARIVGSGAARAFVAVTGADDRVRLEWFPWR